MNTRFNNAPEYVFNNPEYISYVVQYEGDISKDAPLSKDYYITVIDNKYAMITFKNAEIPEERFTLNNNPFPSIVYISKYYLYTLQSRIEEKETGNSISPVISSNINIIKNMKPMTLSGKGVVVGIIDTGIDYLNDAFINNDGTTRVEAIWDQTINSPQQLNVPFGMEFLKEEINRAISISRNGGNPYEVVNSIDENGNGTAMASIIGAKINDDNVISAAPECTFVVVKLQRALAAERALNSEYIYDRGSIMMAIEYLHDYVIENNVPMVIYLPLGTTLGNHRINGLLEDFIDCTCFNIGISVVTGTGNEGESANHASGIIEKAGDFKDVDLYVSKEQSILRMELWTRNPNIMSIEIFSPSGESTGIISAAMKKVEINKFVFEDTIISVQYSLPDDLTGDELIFIALDSLQPGIWKCRIYGDYIIDGRYDMWMYQVQFLRNGTRFLASDYYGTITNPSPGRYSLTVANYNQNNFSIEGTSGVYFENAEYNEIDIACGGVNVRTYGPSNKIVTAKGTGVSSAVASGAAALMMEWGIVNKNDIDMYSQTLKSYFLRGTITRKNDTYPNPQWGYGILDLVGVFRNIE